MGFSGQEWVAVSSSRESSQPRDRTRILNASCIGRQIFFLLFLFLPLAPPGKPAAAKSLQSCPTLCNPIDGSPPGSAISGILQARTWEWVAISFSNAWKWKLKVKSLSRVWLFTTPWTAAYQAPPSMGLPRQEYWSGLPLPSPRGSLLPFYLLFLIIGLENINGLEMHT